MYKKPRIIDLDEGEEFMQNGNSAEMHNQSKRNTHLFTILFGILVGIITVELITLLLCACLNR